MIDGDAATQHKAFIQEIDAGDLGIGGSASLGATRASHVAAPVVFCSEAEHLANLAMGQGCLVIPHLARQRHPEAMLGEERRGRPSAKQTP